MKKLHLFIYLLLLALILPVKAEQDTIRSLIISEWRGDESEKMPEARETPVQAMFYVSPGGDDGNPGTIQSPFQTLEKARDEVRKINREMTGDIIVYVMAGDYHIHHTIEFKGSDSGTNGYRVIYRNHDEPGSARLLGAIPSIGWEKYDDRRYRISVGEDITVNFLYEDNKRSGPARFPNRAEDRHTYMRVAEEDTLQPTGQFYFREGQLPVMEESSPLAIYFFPGGFDWRQTILPVSLIDYENQKIVTESVSGYGFSEGTRYFIMGHAMELLDAPGELVHHKESGTLYYYPRNEDNIYKNNIYIPLVEKIIEFRGDSMASNQGGTVHNITLLA